ncbi:hypothetical protein ACRQ5Q_22400 [Bradyrhizobium sp. PMVTL-01]|uniref:hypothetical protein n=1 Tax=Bradyrhizobium sp. PMVTL-01 TaxID=3434999 RepID=UPI003F70CB7E
MQLHFVAALVWGLVYTVSVFLAGLGLNHHAAWVLALLTMGLAFFAHVAQASRIGSGLVAAWLVSTSWLAGIAAGLALLF